MSDQIEETQKNTKAVVSLSLGILSILTAFFIGLFSLALALPGLIVGILSVKEINEQEETGKGMAVGGIICSSFTIGLQILLILFIALFMT